MFENKLENTIIQSKKQSDITRPKVDAIRIINMSSKHFSDIFRIADKQLGQDYVTHELLTSCTTEKSGYIGRTALDTKTNKVLGFCISFTLLEDDLPDLLNIESDAIPYPLANAQDLGVIKTIAIDRHYKGLGIGTSLIEDALHQFKNIDRNTVFTIAWKSELGTNLHGVLMKTRFKKLIEIPHYWYQSSLETGCHCSVCGKPPCVCSAVIYAKQLI